MSQDAPTYYCVIDFECTCTANSTTPWDHEIIEFPCVLVERKSRMEIARFHRYVRPTERPKLTSFCRDLTDIQQSQVNEAQALPEVLVQFDQWLVQRGLFGADQKPLFAVCFDGPWDVERFLAPECERKRIPFPPYFRHWVDVREHFRVLQGAKRRCNIRKMLEELEMVFEGRPHAGIDDAANIARILMHLLRRRDPLPTNDYLGNKSSAMRYYHRNG